MVLPWMLLSHIYKENIGLEDKNYNMQPALPLTTKYFVWWSHTEAFYKFLWFFVTSVWHISGFW